MKLDVKSKTSINIGEIGITIQTSDSTDIIECDIGPIQVISTQRTFDSTIEIAIQKADIIDKYRMKSLV